MTVRAAIFGADGVQRSETLVDAHVCESCPTAAAVTTEGVIAAFRNRAEGEIRDIYVSRLDATSGRWSERAAVHNDNWTMPACPVNGPSLSASGSRVAIAWFTMQQELGHTFVVFQTTPAARSESRCAWTMKCRWGEGMLNCCRMGRRRRAGSNIPQKRKRRHSASARIERSGVKSPPITVTSISSGRTNS
jgi:hypothetical protein